MSRSAPLTFRNAAPSPVNLALQTFAARLFLLSSSAREKARNAGQIADYMDWQRRVLPAAPDLVSRREVVWERLASRVDPSRPLLVLEFGVAWGYSTDWWLRRLAGVDLEWHGFDRFTGLPRSWREHDEGAFDAGGATPAIEDSRLHWHVGDVEKTLSAVDVTSTSVQKLILFDLDIYEPTAFAWHALVGHLRAGDLLYFDEAMDDDERRVLDELVLPAVEVQPVGTTSMALGLVVTSTAGSARTGS